MATDSSSTQDNPDAVRDKNVGGRPTDYSKELADKICEYLADGQSMRTVCKQEGMPSMSTVFKWLRENEEFSQQYVKAKEESSDAMAEDLLHIADTPVMGEIKTIKPDGSVEIKQDEMLGHRRLQVDTRKWLMAKMKPKKYGDKLDIDARVQQVKPILDGATKKNELHSNNSNS